MVYAFFLEYDDDVNTLGIAFIISSIYTMLLFGLLLTKISFATSHKKLIRILLFSANPITFITITFLAITLISYLSN